MATVQAFVDNIGGGVLQTEWMPLTVLALMASAVMLAAAYVFATFFRNSALIGFVKLEIYELFASALIIVALGVFISALDEIKPSAYFSSLPAGTGIYTATEAYFIKVGEKLAGWMDANYAVNIWIDQMASVTPYARPLGVGLVATPLAGFASPIKQMIYNITIVLGIAFVINQAQLYVFQFAVAGFLKYYLPIGIFLRSFTPTRRIGGTLIAIALVFLVFFPFLTMMNYVIVLGADSPIEGFGKSFTKFVKASYVGAGSGSEREVRDKLEGFSFTGFIEDSAVTMSSFMGNFLKNITGGIMATLFMIPLSTVGMAFAVGYLMPAFNTLMMVEVGKHLSKTMGEEIDLSALTKLI